MTRFCVSSIKMFIKMNVDNNEIRKTRENEFSCHKITPPNHKNLKSLMNFKVKNCYYEIPKS